MEKWILYTLDSDVSDITQQTPRRRWLQGEKGDQMNPVSVSTDGLRRVRVPVDHDGAGGTAARDEPQHVPGQGPGGGKKFVQNTVNAVGICLKRVAVDVIQNNVAITAAASATCVAQFRKINDTRVPPPTRASSRS